MTSEITIIKFLKVYYGMPASKSKYFRHKDLKKLIPELEIANYSDYELSKMISCGACLRIKDCEGVTVCYRNPFYVDVSLENYSFNGIEESKRATNFEHSGDSYCFEETDDYELHIPAITSEELEMLEKWELLELKDKLSKLNKRTMGATYFQISMIKKELSSRKKEQKYDVKDYQKKKDNH